MAQPMRADGRAELADIGSDDRLAERGGEMKDAALRRLPVGQDHQIGVDEKLRHLEVGNEPVADVVAAGIAHLGAQCPRIVAAACDRDAQVGQPLQGLGADQQIKPLVGVDPSEEENVERVC